MATYPDLRNINLNKNMFGGYSSPTAANYGQKLSFIQKYYPQYGSTDAGSIDMMYNKAVELTNQLGSSQKSKIKSRLAETLRTAQSGNVQQPVEKPIQKPVEKKVSAPETQKQSTSNSNTGKKVNMNELFGETPNNGSPIADNNYTPTNTGFSTAGYAPSGLVDTSAFINYDYSTARNIPNQIAQANANTGGYVNPEPSMFDGYKVGNGGGKGYIENPIDSGAVSNSGSSAVQKAMDSKNTLSNKWGNTSYGDAWNQGEGVLGGISNIWDKFTSPNGSMANPAPSGAENFLKSLGGVGTFAGGVADLMYKSKLADLMGRQVDQQQALTNATLDAKDKWQQNYAASNKA